MNAVLTYLDRVDPAAAARARARYGCFGHAGKDSTAYAYAAGLGLGSSCENEVVQQLEEMSRRALEHARNDGGSAGDELFHVEQNARLVKNAEEYYRSIFRGATVNWNLRDRHMADTLGAIVQHLDHELGRTSKVCIWAHNSHLGDARATEMAREGELNVGQLVRERDGRDGFLVGFTTYEGEVSAASDWDAPERRSHFFRAHLADQFDAVIHVDRTRAVEPLGESARGPGLDAPDTFPFAV